MTPTPFVSHVGIAIDEHRPGHSRCSLRVVEHHLNSFGSAHGGALFSLADTAMGAALYASLEPGQACATIDIRIAYFRPVVDGSVSCIAVLLHKGRNVANLEAEIRQGDALVAKASGSFSMFERRAEPAGARAA